MTEEVEVKEELTLEQKVKIWLKHNREWVKNNKRLRDSKDWKERAEYGRRRNYVDNLNRYLRTGVYLDLFYGMNMESKVQYACYAKAYDENGEVKRNIGTWYDDVGMWTEEKKEVQESWN